MQKLLFTLLTLSVLLLARNDVPSCYKALKIEDPNPTSQKELFILIDQTTPIDKNMMIYTYKNMMKFIKNGYAVSIASFSSNANGKYTDVAYSGKLEALLPQSAKHDIAKKALRKYEGCMNGQYQVCKEKSNKSFGLYTERCKQKVAAFRHTEIHRRHCETYYTTFTGKR